MSETKPLKKDLAVADQGRLGRILDSDPKTLSTADREFIFARRDYLTADERKAMGITKASIEKATAANEASDEDTDDDEDNDV